MVKISDTSLVIEAEASPDTRPDIVLAVYGTGRAEARLRRRNDVIAEETTLATLVLRLVSSFPDGVHLDIRYDPHM